MHGRERGEGGTGGGEGHEVSAELTGWGAEPQVANLLRTPTRKGGGGGGVNSKLTQGRGRGDENTPLIGMLAPLIGADSSFDENIRHETSVWQEESSDS